MIVAWVPLAIAIIGALVYVLATRSEAKELGRIAYFCGLFFVVASLVGHTVHLP